MKIFYYLFDDDKQLIIRNYSNEESREFIIRLIMLYEDNRKFDFDTYDTSDITTKYLEHEKIII